MLPQAQVRVLEWVLPQAQAQAQAQPQVLGRRALERELWVVLRLPAGLRHHHCRAY